MAEENQKLHAQLEALMNNDIEEQVNVKKGLDKTDNDKYFNDSKYNTDLDDPFFLEFWDKGYD